MGSDFTHFHGGCHDPVPLETAICFERAAAHSMSSSRFITSRAITKAWFARSPAAIRSAHAEDQSANGPGELITLWLSTSPTGRTRHFSFSYESGHVQREQIVRVASDTSQRQQFAVRLWFSPTSRPSLVRRAARRR